MRELLRSIARAKMKKAGVCHMNKPRRVLENGKPTNVWSSYFAENWRRYINR